MVSSLRNSIFCFSFTLGLIFFASADCKGQPSYGVGFLFKLFDSQGKSVNYEKFCEEYQMLGELDRNDQTSCHNENLPKEYTFNNKTNFFNGSGMVVYNDLLRKFIHEKDTMTLILITNEGRSLPYKIDSLFIKPGKYVITDHNLKSINFKKAEVDYYNYLLNWVLGIKKQIANYRDSEPYIELCKLKRKYNISIEDYEEKKIKDILKKSN